MQPLPVDEVCADLCTRLRKQGAALLIAPPGSGKTTRVPGALIDAGLQGEVWVLQPRRLAARAAARRVAEERGSRLGGEVGYQVRQDKKAGKDTRIRFVTEGILLRRILADPFLEGVGAVVLDEFHERSLEADQCLCMLREIRETVREDLQVLVMSATLHAEPLLQYLAPCALVETRGSLHPVEVRYLPQAGREIDLLPAVRQALEESRGDLLVFLPGVREIERGQRQLAELARRQDLALLPLHGRLPAKAQDQAIRPGPRRKIVLSTNVAETSVTIDGVTAVVDAGLQRQLRHDSGRGMDRLETQRISQASAEQRRGRAGRTAPGICYRLWSPAEERGMLAFDLPEIRRLDLSGLCLAMRAFAGRDPAEIAWFEPPEASALQRADILLRLLGALQGQQVTGLGQQMLRHPLHPRLARLLEEGRRRDCAFAAAEAAALLAERDLQRGRGAAAELSHWRELLHEVEARGFDPALCRQLQVDPAAARAVVDLRRQLHPGGPEGGESDEALTLCLLAAYPDRVGGRCQETDEQGVMASGRGFRLEMREHHNLGRLFLCLQVRESPGRDTSRSLVSLALPIEEAWLETVFAGAVQEVDEVELDRKRGLVVAMRRRRFGQLVLEEKQAGAADPGAAAELLAAELAQDPWRYLGEQKELRAFLARLAWVHSQDPESSLPQLDDAALVGAARQLLPGCRRLSEVAGLPILDLLKAELGPAVLNQLERDAPASLRLPAGRRAQIDYQSGDQPFVAARIQELYGLSEVPRLAGGRVPLLLHLLGPNHRPVQVTSDLPSFWDNTYPGVRAELKRRYPKHSWPEDPRAASPESRPRRRR